MATMLNTIFANLATGFAAQFGAPFQEVSAQWPGTAVYDTGGSIVTPGTPEEWPCQAQFDTPTESMRRDPGFLERDMRLLVLTATLERTLTTEAQIVVASGEHAGTWSIETCQGDPAGIGWECRCRKVA